VRLAVPARGLPAPYVDRLRIPRRLAGRRRYLNPAARRSAHPGQDGAGRNAEPTAAIIDSQSVRAADTVPKASRGWDNAKKVNGRKRHIAVDTTGLLLAVVITAASVQDRDGARPLLWNLHRASRRVRLI
jgi:Transposase DDE domain